MSSLSDFVMSSSSSTISPYGYGVPQTLCQQSSKRTPYNPNEYVDSRWLTKQQSSKRTPYNPNEWTHAG
nr:hypothetical protein BgiMline_002779 [Biomphalaria glabrata]